MVAQSEAVMATGVALVMGAGIAAMAAVNGGRLGGGGGLDRARGASTIPAERSGSGKGGYSTSLWAHALVSAARSAATLKTGQSRAGTGAFHSVFCTGSAILPSAHGGGGGRTRC